jgi:trimeric autotransporter adhesin
MKMMLSGVTALSLGAGVAQAQTATCVTLRGGTGCNPVVSDNLFNTAMGTNAFNPTTTGYINTASGVSALRSNTTGAYNTASGNYALASNTTGNQNTASGSSALSSNTTGNNLTAIGYEALNSNTTGLYSTALGFQALNNSVAGLANIGVGPLAGKNIVQGQLNIDIGSWGTVDESNTIRIGLPQYHLKTYVAGIASTQLTGAQVVVTANGQLGVLASSERYKTDITSLRSSIGKLAMLRPVSFHLKTEPNGAIQYGLIAEEVDKVYPELVIRDNDGKIQGVRYDEVAPILLNEVQALSRQHEVDTLIRDAQSAKIAVLEQKVAEVGDLKQQLSAVIQELQSRDKLVAQR